MKRFVLKIIIFVNFLTKPINKNILFPIKENSNES